LLHDLYPLHRIDIRMDITTTNIHPFEIISQLFSHPFGKCGHQNALIFFSSQVNLLHQIINLINPGSDFNPGIQQASWSDDLLHNHTFTLLKLIIGRRCADKHDLAGNIFKLFKFQGAVINGCGKPKAIINQGYLPGPVSAVHCMNLGHRDVTFVNHHQVISGKIIEQTKWARARFPAVKVTRIVFYSGAITQFADHLQIIGHAIFNALCLHKFSGPFEKIDMFHKVILYFPDCKLNAILCCDKNSGRIDHTIILPFNRMAIFRIKEGNLFNFIPEKDNPDPIIGISRKNVNSIPFHTKISTLKKKFTPRVHRINEFA